MRLSKIVFGVLVVFARSTIVDNAYLERLHAIEDRYRPKMGYVERFVNPYITSPPDHYNRMAPAVRMRGRLDVDTSPVAATTTMVVMPAPEAIPTVHTGVGGVEVAENVRTSDPVPTEQLLDNVDDIDGAGLSVMTTIIETALNIMLGESDVGELLASALN